MYIRKSFLKGIVLLFGSAVLLVLVFFLRLYTDTNFRRRVYGSLYLLSGCNLESGGADRKDLKYCLNGQDSV